MINPILIAQSSNNSIDWFTTIDSHIDYQQAVLWMQAKVQDIQQGQSSQAIWFLEHPPIYTSGTSARSDDLLNSQFPVYETGRGGQITYHGPGQLIGYVMVDLNQYNKDLKWYIKTLEDWLIAALEKMNVRGLVRPDRVGIWVEDDQFIESKIAAIGVRISKWVTYHGFSLNINPDLSHYDGIVPCGISKNQYGVTSLKHMGVNVDRAHVEQILRETCPF